MIKNIISTFFTRGLVAFINLAVLLISSKQLGAEIIGQVSLLILNITIIQIVNEIYTGYSTVHFIAKYSAQKIYLTGLLWTVGCIGLLNLLFFFFNIGRADMRLHTAILSFMGTLSSFNCVILLAKQKIRIYNFLVFFQPAVLMLSLFFNVFASEDKTLHGYISAMYVSFSLSVLASGFFVIRVLSKKSSAAVEGPFFKEIIQTGFIGQAGNLAHTLSNRLNFYLLSSALLIGIYSRASSLIESVWLVSASISPIILTRVANQNTNDANGKVTFILAKLSLLLSLACVIFVLCLPDSFFIFLLGKDFTGIKELMLLLSPGVLFISFSTVLSHYFSGNGEQKVQLIANSLGLLTTVCSAAFFIKNYGLTGACYVSSLSYFVQALVLTIVFMRQNGFQFQMLFAFRKELKFLKK